MKSTSYLAGTLNRPLHQEQQQHARAAINVLVWVSVWLATAAFWRGVWLATAWAVGP